MDFSTAISPQIARALSNTFIYSLWQGLVLAALAGGIILLTCKSASRKRYNLLIGSLVLFSVSVVITFICQLQQSVVVNTPPLTFQYTISPALAGDSVASPAVPVNNTSFIGYINEHANTIVLIWFLIVCVRCLQLLTGLHGLYRLRHQSVSPVGKEWEEKLQALAKSIGIKQMVAVAESGLAKVPMVIGHLKPIILIPAGLITAMPPAEIEAILLHELAHIRRRDYLVNLLQNLVEIIFFFNPAVLWISSLIKAERENCCDDITLKQTDSKAAYIRALLSCQEYQSQTSRFAMALGRRKNLLGRVSRMVSSRNHSLSILEKSLLTVCLVTAGLVFAAFSDKETKQEEIALKTEKNKMIADSGRQALVKPSDTDTIHPKAIRIYQPSEVGEGTSLTLNDTSGNVKYTTYLFKKEGTVYQINLEEGKRVSLQVNGKTIPSDKWVAYQSTVDRLISGEVRGVQSGPVQIKEPDEPAEQVARDRERQIADEKNADINSQQQKINAEYKTSAVDYKATNLEAKPDVKLYTNNATLYHPDTAYLKPDMQHYKTGVQEYVPKDEHKELAGTDLVISYMVKEGIVARPKDIKSFLISNDELIVNGKKESADVHQRIVDKYIKTNTKRPWSIMYNFDTSGPKTTTRTVINID
ncbi:MAG: M56 family metallopeptidase [Chitinophagaceae bacterium]